MQPSMTLSIYRLLVLSNSADQTGAERPLSGSAFPPAMPTASPTVHAQIRQSVHPAWSPNNLHSPAGRGRGGVYLSGFESGELGKVPMLANDLELSCRVRGPFPRETEQKLINITIIKCNSSPATFGVTYLLLLVKYGYL